jgi:hypothetical protein
MEPNVWGVYLGYPVPGKYKYGDLAFQVGGVSNVTVKYGYEVCGTSARGKLLWQGPEASVRVNYRPILSSERASHNKKPAIVRQNKNLVMCSR